jgi:broad specificity phosphatase PhoE
MTEIVIAWHAHNEDSANEILNGHCDLPLRGLDRAQARELGKGIRLAGLQFDAVYGSPLSRECSQGAVGSKGG